MRGRQYCYTVIVKMWHIFLFCFFNILSVILSRTVIWGITKPLLSNCVSYFTKLDTVPDSSDFVPVITL